MLEGELTDHLDYEKHQNSNGTSNRRNGSSGKKDKSTYGKMQIDVPRDRVGSLNHLL